MHPLAKLLIVLGAGLILLGLLWPLGSAYLNFGHLPGDISRQRGNFRFEFPIVTCSVISVALSVLLTLAGRDLR